MVAHRYVRDQLLHPLASGHEGFHHPARLPPSPPAADTSCLPSSSRSRASVALHLSHHQRGWALATALGCGAQVCPVSEGEGTGEEEQLCMRTVWCALVRESVFQAVPCRAEGGCVRGMGAVDRAHVLVKLHGI